MRDGSDVIAKDLSFKVVDSSFEKFDSLDASIDDIECGPHGVFYAVEFVIVHRSPSSLKLCDDPKWTPSLGLRLCFG